ncbi:MAG TPA: outer membrane protein assembly factor BamD [Flavobacteriales bacterium]|nr:outer membrane protein assembly factor BamD [Flavobacteriales bacterium]
MTNRFSTHLSFISACWAALLLGSTLFFGTSCSEYNKIMKSTDLDYKYERALGFLDSNKCYGALPLLEEVVSLTRGTERSVDAQYNFAQAHRCVGDYYLARYYFKLFAKTFPNDPRAEKAQFESAICSYILSPKPSLDQLDTEQAIEEFQLFMDRYPASAFRDSSQKMIDELRYKLEVKSFESAYNYYHTGNYKSAVIAFENALKEYPDTPYREQMQWLIVDGYFKYAELSTERRKLERYNDTIEAFLTFVARYPESQYRDQVQDVYEKCLKAIDDLAEN